MSSLVNDFVACVLIAWRLFEVVAYLTQKNRFVYDLNYIMQQSDYDEIRKDNKVYIFILCIVEGLRDV